MVTTDNSSKLKLFPEKVPVLKKIGKTGFEILVMYHFNILKKKILVLQLKASSPVETLFSLY